MTKLPALVVICILFATPAWAEVCDETSPDCRESIDIPDIYIINVDPEQIIAVLMYCREQLEGTDIEIRWDSDGTPTMHEIEAKGRAIWVEEITQIIKALREDK